MNWKQKIKRMPQRIKDCIFGYHKEFEKAENVNIPIAIQYLALAYYFTEHLRINNHRSEWRITNGYQAATLITKDINSQYNSIIGDTVIKNGNCQWNIKCMYVTSTIHCGIMNVKQDKVNENMIDKDMGKTMRKKKGYYYVISNNGTQITKSTKEIKFIGSVIPKFGNGDVISINLNATKRILTFKVKDKISKPINLNKNENGYRLFCGLFDNGDCIEIDSFVWCD